MDYSLLGLIILVLDVVAIISVLRSGMDMGMKILWIALIVLLPIIGMVLYFLMNRSAISRA